MIEGNDLAVLQMALAANYALYYLKDLSPDFKALQPDVQNLGHALKGIVFSKEVNVTYGWSPIILHCHCHWTSNCIRTLNPKKT